MRFEAIELATKVHRGQFLKGTKIRYIIHPFQVAKLLINLECSDEVVAAALPNQKSTFHGKIGKNTQSLS
ncbi:MAG: hypothetical protein IME96_03550 [Proteobacteria bacterium]|nr:hypothetical protein [Pseudomonadota bacterium]